MSPSVPGADSTAGDKHDRFDLLKPDASGHRMTVTESAAVRARHSDRGHTDKSDRASDLLFGALVHRLLQLLHRGVTDREEIKRRARGLLRADEKAGVDNCDALVNRAADAYLAILEQPDVTSLMAADCLFELPFSLRLEPRPDGPMASAAGTPVIVRGTIDCLVRKADGNLTVLEVKTGGRQPEHKIQLDLYLLAARELFPGVEVDGVLVYAGNESPYVDTVN